MQFCNQFSILIHVSVNVGLTSIKKGSCDPYIENLEEGSGEWAEWWGRDFLNSLSILLSFSTNARSVHVCLLTEVPLSDLPTLLETLEMDEFIKLAEASNLLSDVIASDANNLTIFVPSNDALNSFIGVVAETSPGINLQVNIKSMHSICQCSWLL